MVYQVMIQHLSGDVIREMLIILAQRGCKTVGAFICRLWWTTVICSRFLIYYGITGDMLVIKNSASTRAISSLLQVQNRKENFYVEPTCS